jgi:hypothetical protein
VAREYQRQLRRPSDNMRDWPFEHQIFVDEKDVFPYNTR